MEEVFIILSFATGEMQPQWQKQCTERISNFKISAFSFCIQQLNI